MHRNPYALTLVQGKRFRKVWRWPQSVKAYKAISGMPTKTPVRLTVTGHEVRTGWPIKISGVRGPGALNGRWVRPTRIDNDTIEINALNAGDLPDYSGGGFIEYYLPVDLTGYAGQAMLKESVADVAPALDISTANNRMTLDNTEHTITFDVPGSVVTAMTKFAGIWDWEMTSGGVTVSPLGGIALPPWVVIKEAVA